jgi:DNA-binding transcriptional regulator PaaX
MAIKGSDIAKVILATLGVAGLLIVAFAAPNALQAFKPFMGEKRSYTKRQIKQSLTYLSKKELIEVTNHGDHTSIKLTKVGREKYKQLHADELTLPVPNKWDRKWRVVCFDVPEAYKAKRTAFLKKLKELGFISLQKSVLVWPYDCEQEIELLSDVYEIYPFVRYLLVEKIDRVNNLKKAFKLL